MGKSTTNTDGVQRISLFDSLDGEWIKLPKAAMLDVGPAAQTLGAIMRISNRETYVCAAEIAGKARLPLLTVRKHIKTLDAAGWIKNDGRQPTRRGNLRRTATIKVTAKTNDAAYAFGFLPWWACGGIRKVGKLRWSTRAVLSIVMAKLAKLAKTAGVQDDAATGEDFVAFLETLGGRDRFRLGLDELHQASGLHRESIVDAKRSLHQLNIIRRKGIPRGKKGTACESDWLIPNFGFRVVITPASPGCCFVEFQGGSEFG